MWSSGAVGFLFSLASVNEMVLEQPWVVMDLNWDGWTVEPIILLSSRSLVYIHKCAEAVVGLSSRSHSTSKLSPYKINLFFSLTFLLVKQEPGSLVQLLWCQNHDFTIQKVFHFTSVIFLALIGWFVMYFLLLILLLCTWWRIRKTLSEQTETTLCRDKLVKVLEELQAQAEVGLCFVGVKH